MLFKKYHNKVIEDNWVQRSRHAVHLFRLQTTHLSDVYVACQTIFYLADHVFVCIYYYGYKIYQLIVVISTVYPSVSVGGLSKEILINPFFHLLMYASLLSSFNHHPLVSSLQFIHSP